MAKDRWPELCQSVESDDGLLVREVGSWTEEKLFHWNRYIDITTRSMVGNPNWAGGLCYVDLFAGPGICRLKGTSKRIPGSPFIATHAPKPFSRIVLVEKDPVAYEACAARVQQSPAAGSAVVLQGDCNELVERVAAELPQRALTLAFIDPEGLDANFETIRKLTHNRRVDLLLLFADAYDVLRNVERYKTDPDSKLDQVLGPDSDWRSKWDALPNQEGPYARALFAQIYQDQLRQHLGYVMFGQMTMRSAHGPLYKLIYASKSERGLEFWDKVTRKGSGGQLSWDFA